MRCYLCKSEFRIDSLRMLSDRYQRLINNGNPRDWYECPFCEFMWQENQMTEEDRKQIYLKYRNQRMRKTTVKQEFERINNIDFPESENKQRVMWLTQFLDRPKSMLDIGSGLGVFPHAMRHYVSQIYCVEPDQQSAEFINGLGMTSINGFYPGVRNWLPDERSFDLITLVHVLEHVQDPISFLKNIKQHDLTEKGTLFVEVPDAVEFDYLSQNNDEFNSMHLWFFNASTLDRILRMAGFNAWTIRRKKYSKRSLSRIMALCSI